MTPIDFIPRNAEVLTLDQVDRSCGGGNAKVDKAG
jgi:hypothetical protein